MSKYSVYLPSYSVGTDAYADIPYVTRFFGKKAVVIGGKTAMAKSKAALEEGVRDSDTEITDFIWYGGDSTHANVDMLLANDAVRNADMIFAVGGGRAIDTVKCVADKLDKPLFTFPTVASNCAPVTAIAVFYNDDGSFCDYYYPKLANHCFINTAVISDSPEQLLWAGIGDALSKECEVEFSSRNINLAHTPLMGRQLCRVCTEPLIKYGKDALDSIRTHTPSFALEQVTLDIIVSTGIVSNMMTTKDDYYYNSTLAHCVYYGATVTENGHKHLHGEIVSLGVLCLLEYDHQEENLKRIMEFNRSIGLPICFDDIGISENEFGIMADKFTRSTEWAHMPQGVTREKYIEAMKKLNERGRAAKRG